MRGKNLLWISLLSVLVITSGLVMSAKSQIYTTLSIKPANFLSVYPGTFLHAEVWVNNVTGLSGWEVKLTWDPMILKILLPYDAYVLQGDFLSQGGTYLTKFAFKVSIVGEYVRIAELLLDPVTTSGSGLLASVDFFVQGAGDTKINLVETKLYDINVAPIPHESYGSKVNVHAYAEVTSVRPEKLRVDPAVDPMETLYGSINNVGEVDVYAWIDFMGVDPTGAIVHITTPITLIPLKGGSVTVSTNAFDVTEMGLSAGTYWFDARAYWQLVEGQSPAPGVPGFIGFKVKHTKFVVL